ncbi:AAA family ATPase [Cellulomonas persica]|uniref:AAA family ATPase n=1 Tax=Cellulomonas persica TaxID=76861 RepID=UPI001649A5DC|nr:AAA family ATPase [Cellulomonas persica]
MLTTLCLRNFKSFGDVSVPFGPFTLIYGSNGVGKSNLLDALRFLLAIGQGRSVRDAIEGHASAAGGPTATVMTGIRGGAQNLPRYAAQTSVFELEVTLDNEQAGKITYTVAVDTSAYKIVREELKAARHSGAYVFSTHPDVAPLKQAPDSPAIAARYYTSSPGRNPSRSFSSHEFIINQFTGRKAETVANERWADVVRRELAALTPLELHPEVLRQYSPLGRFTLGEHGENFAAVTWSLLARAEIDQTVTESPGRAWPNIITAARRDGLDLNDESLDDETSDARARLAAICSWLAELTPRQIEGIAVEWAPTNEVIFSLFEAPHDRPLNARVLSDGTLRLAALAVALLGENRRETFVIEEIENGVNPARVQLLLRLVETATRPGGGKQVIATTHAPALLDSLSESLRRYTLVLGWDEENETSVVTSLEDLPGLEEAEGTSSLGDLLTEGWVQMAADR